MDKTGIQKAKIDKENEMFKVGYYHLAVSNSAVCNVRWSCSSQEQDGLMEEKRQDLKSCMNVTISETGGRIKMERC